MSNQGAYLMTLRESLIGYELTAANQETLTMATSAGDIIRIAVTGMETDVAGIACMSGRADLLLGRTVHNLRFTPTFHASGGGPGWWSVGLDALLDDAETGGWHGLASCSLHGVSGILPPDRFPTWPNRVTVLPGRHLLHLAKKDAGLL